MSAPVSHLPPWSALVNSLGMGFEACYRMPGITGAHEKDGVEGEVGRFRRNRLVLVPSLNYS